MSATAPWILTEGLAGLQAQALGLAEAAGLRTDLRVLKPAAPHRSGRSPRTGSGCSTFSAMSGNGARTCGTIITMVHPMTVRNGRWAAIPAGAWSAAVPGTAIQGMSAPACATSTAAAPGTTVSVSVFPEPFQLLHPSLLTSWGGSRERFTLPWSIFIDFPSRHVPNSNRYTNRPND